MKKSLFLLGGLLWAMLAWAQTPVQPQPQTLATPIQIKMSPEAGFYKGSVLVEMSCNYPKATIYYSVNGSRPGTGSLRYTKPILIDSTAVIQAVAYVDGQAGREVNTYVFGFDNTKLPVASLSIEPSALFDPVKGVFQLGPRAVNRFPYKGANWNSRQEFLVHWEYFEEDKTQAFEGDYGFKMFGGVSRMFPQKSFALAARKDLYGTKSIDYPIFPDKDIKKFKHIVFRNSGSDFGGTHFRDAMITSLGREMGLEVQAYRPCHTFINGEYWGIYNLREKINRFFLRDNLGYDADSVDLVEHQKSVSAGTRKHYDRMQNYMRNNDLSVQRHFDTVATMMDVENFMEYEIMQMYIHNKDAGGNIKFWRPQKPDGRWRWILFDTDFGFGHDGGLEAYKFNTIAFHLEPNGPGWPNPPWSTFNLRMLMKNKGFQDAFVLRFADRLNSTFQPDHVVERINKMAEHIQKEMPRHWQRWKLDTTDWYKRVERMRKFAKERPKYMRILLRQHFPSIGDEVKLKLQIDTGGVVVINTVIEAEYNWEGVYFKNLPVTIKAKPRIGYQFSHWEEGDLRINDREIKVKFVDSIRFFRAVFVKGEHPLAKAFIINEISCRDSVAGDWIEFFNSSNEAVDLAGWRLRDGNGNEFVFPSVQIKASDYLILCRDLKKFQAAFPKATNVIEGLNFGLGSKETLEIFDPQGDPIDSVSYKIPKDYKGQTVTLALRDYAGDNSGADSWKVVPNTGSPAVANPNYIEENKSKQISSLLYYLKIGGIALGALFAAVGIYTAVRKRMRKS